MLKYKISSSVVNFSRDSLYKLTVISHIQNFVEDMTFKMACSFIDILGDVSQRL